MNKDYDIRFNTALRAALDELLSEDIREVEKSASERKKRRVRYILAAAAIIICMSIPIAAYVSGFSLIKHKDYHEVSVSSDKTHSGKIDSFVIGYLPDGWNREILRDSDEIKRIRVYSESAEIIISKEVYDSNNTSFIDDHFGEPEMILHDDTEYYYFNYDNYSMVTFVHDFYYVLDADNVSREELLEIAFAIK